MRTKQQKGSKKHNRSHSLEGLEGRRMLAAHIQGNANTYATIQAAVDAAVAGAIVTVDAGTYAEQVYVGKSITIRGAQSGNDARSNTRLGAGVPETIVTGAPNSSGQNSSAFYIAANNVTIDGFTVQGQTTQGDGGAGLVIAPSKAGTHVYNNIFQSNVSGLFLSNNSSTNPAIIQYNVFRNNNNSGANGGRGLYTNGSISGGSLTNVLIDSNFFMNNRGSGSTTGLEAAVAFEAASAGSQSNIRITNNSFDNNGKATLFFNTTGITITGNYITNTLDQYSGTLRFEGNNQNVTIQNNTIYDNTGPAVAVDSKGMPGDNAGFVITSNNFFNNNIGWSSGKNLSVAIDGSVYDGVPDVRNNYWGSSTGPSGDGSGTGDSVYGIGHVVPGGQWSVTKGGVELFSPWATAPVGVNRSAYFGLPWSDGANIQFEDFDHGGAGVAYSDTTSSTAGVYRKREQVDLENTSDTGGGYDVNNVVAGEWLTYTINLAQGGVFNLDMRVASAKAGGTFHVEVDGVNLTGTLTVPSTGAAQTWTTLSKTGLSISGGQHLLKFVFDSNGAGGTVGSFNSFKLTNTAPVALPATPTNLTVVASGFAAVNLTWSDNATSETGYVVERRLPGGSFAVIATLGSNASSYTDSTVLSSQTYDYRVKALGSAGNSAYSNISTVTTGASQTVTYLSDLPFTGTPTNGWGPIERDQTVGGQALDDGQTIALNGVSYSKGLGVNAISDVSFTLGGGYKQFLADVGVDDKQQYDGSVDFQVFADGVKIYDSGVLTPTTATGHINLDVTGVQTLRLHVDDGGDGPDFDQADWADARLTLNSAPPPPPTTTVPNAPSGLGASAASSSQVNLTWSDVAGETSYSIERSTDGVNFTPIGTTTADVTIYSDTSATAGKTYQYRVKAINSAGTSGASNIASASTPAAPTAPAAPVGLLATAISQTRIDLTWSANGATSYKIERSLDNGVTFTQIATSTTASYSDTTATAGKTFVYRVRATNSVGDSAYSTNASVTTPAAQTVPVAPTGLGASAISSTQVNLTWSATANTTSYKIERSADNGATFTQIGTSSTTSYSDTTVAASKSYVYRLRATNAVGDSIYSAIASVTTPAAPVLSWSNTTIGVMGPAPILTVNAGTYTLKGTGTGIGSTADNFQFVYQQLTGDGTIIARVASVQNTSNTAQAGIMMRDGLAANAKEISVVANASSVYGVSAISRSSAGGSSSTSNKYFVGTPIWLKLVRSGNTITSYRSSDGVKWTKVTSQTITMSSTIYVGMVVASKSATVVNTSTFDNVSISK